MVVTIYSDAAFHPKFNIGAYAFWIVSNVEKIRYAAPLKKQAKRAEIAEFRGIINAIYTVGKRQYKRVGKIIVNTDCMNVIHLIKDDRQAIYRYSLGWGRNLVSDYHLVLKKFNIPHSKIELRHVKAHTNRDDTRSYLNDWCDQMAKQKMWEQIHLIYGKEKTA